MTEVKMDYSDFHSYPESFDPRFSEWHYRDSIEGIGQGNTMRIDLQGNDPSQPNFVDFSEFKPDFSDLRITADDGISALSFRVESLDLSARTARIWVNLEA